MLNRNGDVVTRGIPGDTYYWENDVLTQSLDCPEVISPEMNIPECGIVCSRRSFEPFYSYTNQTMNSCSLPMTVE